MKLKKSKPLDWKEADILLAPQKLKYDKNQYRFVIFNDGGDIAWFEFDHLNRIFYLQNAKTNEEILGLHEDISGVIKLLKKHKWI